MKRLIMILLYAAITAKISFCALNSAQVSLSERQAQIQAIETQTR